LPATAPQAASRRQPAGKSRHTTTANAKVAGTIAASPLVEERLYLFSHGKGHSFETS
jgi:hypothetical protein